MDNDENNIPVLYHTQPKYKKKIEMVNDLLDETRTKRSLHYQQYAKFKRLGSLLSVSINLCNTISVCSIVLNFQPEVNITIVSLVSTTLSSLLSVFVSGYEIHIKISKHQTSYLQYADLFRDVSARIQRNGLSSGDLDVILTEINSRLGLIEDGSLPLSFIENNT
jgi:hypothetical protein